MEFGVREHFSSQDGFLLLDAAAEASTTDFLKVMVQLVNPTNADFATLYKEVERNVHIELSSIKLSLDPTYIVKAATFALKDLLPALDIGATQDTPISVNVSGAVGDTTEFDLASGPLIETYQPKTSVEFVFSGLNISLVEGSLVVGWMETERFTISVALVGKRLNLNGAISSMKVTSRTEKASMDLIYFEGGSVASFQFESNCVATEDLIEGSNLATLNSGSLRIAYDAEAYAYLLKTAFKFLQIADIAAAPEVPQQTSSSNVQRRQTIPSPIANYLKVQLDSPIITIPSADGTDFLSFHLGTLQVSNKIEMPPDRIGFDQLFSISLMDIHVSLVEAKENTERTLLQEFSIPLKVRLMHEAKARNFADVEIDGDIPLIEAGLSESDFGRTMQIVQDATSSISKIIDSLPKTAASTSTAPLSTVRSSAIPSSASSSSARPLSTPIPSSAIPSSASPSSARPLSTAAHAATSSDKEDGHFPLDAKLQLQGLHVKLKNDKDGEMVKLAVDGIDISVVSNTKTGMGVEVCIESLQVADVSNAKLYFNDLIAIGVAAEGLNKPLVDSRKQILFRLDQRLDQSMAVNVYVESPRVFVLFDSIFYMKKFFLANLPTPVTGGGAQKVQEVDDTQQSTLPQLSLTFNMLDANLIIPDDRSIRDTDALSLRVGSFSVKLTKDLKVDVDDVSSFIYNMSAPDATRITVIDYFSSLVHLTNDVSKQSSQLDGTVYPLTVTLSYQDMQLVLSFLGTMAKAQERHAYNVNPITEGAIEDESPVSTIPSNGKVQEKGTIDLEFVRIIVIDDSASANVPLLELKVDSISMDLSDWSTSLQALAKATLAVNCYNPSITYWEPVLEPWSFSISMGKLESEPNSDSTLLLSSEKGLELIILHDALERILSMVSKLGVEKRSPLASREISSPYIFGNYLDLPVKIIRSALDGADGGGSTTENAKEINLSPNMTEKFTFEDFRKQRSSLLDVTHRMTFDFGEAYQPIKRFAIDQDGYFSMNIIPVDEQAQASREFFVRTFIVDGVRHAHLREKIMIHNETESLLLFTMEGQDNGKSVQIEAGKKACVPQEFEHSSISLTPIVEELQLAPVQQSFSPVNFSSVNGRIFSAQSSLNTEATFNILASCERPDVHSIMDIKFVAPIVVENLLPVNIQVQFRQGNQRKVYDIQESQCISVYHFDPGKPCVFALSIPDLSMFSTNECDIIRGGENCELVMQNEQGLELKVSLTRGALATTALHLSIAAYYLLVNQTNMTLQILSEANNKVKRNEQVFSLPPAEDGRPLLLFSHPNPKSAKNRARLRIADSNWSEPVSFEAVGADFSMDVKSMLTTKWYNIGGNVSLGLGKFGLTKVVYIASRYYVVNDTTEDLTVGDSSSQLMIPSKSQLPIQIDPSNIECIMIKSGNSRDEDWSAPFDVKNTGKVYVRDDPKNQLFRVGRAIRSPSFFITLTVTDSWPYIIRNQSSLPLTFRQRNVDTSHECPAKSQVNYAWDQPSFNEKQLLLTMEEKEVVLDAFEIGKRNRFKIKSAAGTIYQIELEVKAQGPVVVIELRDRYSTDTALSETSAEGDRQNESEYAEVFDSVILARIPSIIISLVSGGMKEILLLYVKDIEARYALSKQFLSYGLTIKWLQIDNQAFDWDHPMLLYPAVLSKSKKELEEHPFLSFGAIQSRDRSYGVTYYKYFGLLVQEMALEMGEELLRNVLNFANLSVLVAQPKTIVTKQDCIVAPYAVERDSSEVLFFEFFQIHPVKINLTFSTTEDLSEAKSTSSASSYNPLSAVIDVLIMTFGNISEAPMKFNALVLENILSRQATLQEIVVEHYKSEVLSQVHLVLGSADFLGNPVGLVSTLGSGVTDLFYEPYQGFVSDRPQDIGIGFARGGISLVKKTVSGLSGTLSKFTGSLARGLSAVTMDKSWQQRRRVDRAKNKPRHALSGVSTGVRQLYTGFKSGLTGVVDKPWEGAREGGVGGFFKGVGVGLVGAITKPVVGIIDMTTSLTEGIKGSAEDNQHTVTQVRFPRVVPFDQKVRPYDLREAFGQSILIGIIGFNQVGKEFYITYIDVPGEDCVVILTNTRMMYANVDRLKIIWEVSLESISDIKTTMESLHIEIAAGERTRTKVIPVIDKLTKQLFVEAVKKQIALKY